MSAPPETGAVAASLQVRDAKVRAVKRWSAEWVMFVRSSLSGIGLAIAGMAGWVPETIALAIFAVSLVGLNLMLIAVTLVCVYVRPQWRVNPMERRYAPCALLHCRDRRTWRFRPQPGIVTG